MLFNSNRNTSIFFTLNSFIRYSKSASKHCKKWYWTIDYCWRYRKKLWDFKGSGWSGTLCEVGQKHWDSNKNSFSNSQSSTEAKTLGISFSFSSGLEGGLSRWMLQVRWGLFSRKQRYCPVNSKGQRYCHFSNKDLLQRVRGQEPNKPQRRGWGETFST